MLVKMMMTLLTVSGMGLSIAACSHQNPLANPDKQKVATFLVKASQYAEQQMKLGLNPGGYVYADCMDGKAKADCDVLYDDMLSYSKHQPGFKHLTRDDLTDKRLWHTNANAYIRAQFSQL